MMMTTLHTKKWRGTNNATKNIRNTIFPRVIAADEGKIIDLPRIQEK